MKLLILLAITTLTGVHMMQIPNEAMQGQWDLKDQHHGDHCHHRSNHGEQHHHGYHHMLDVHQMSEMLQEYLQQGTQSLSKFYQDLGERLRGLTRDAQHTFEQELSNLSRYINENLEKFRRHSFFHKLSAEVQQRLEAIRHDTAQHLKSLDPRLLQEAVGQRIGELRDQLAHTFKHLLHNKIEYAQEVKEKVMNRLDDFKEQWGSLKNLYDCVLEQFKKIQEAGMKMKGVRKGDMKGGQKGNMKGGQKGNMKGGQKGNMKGGQKGNMKGGQKENMKGGQKGNMKGGCKGNMKGGCKGNKKGDSDEISKERDTQENVYAWLKAFSKSIKQHSH